MQYWTVNIVIGMQNLYYNHLGKWRPSLISSEHQKLKYKHASIVDKSKSLHYMLDNNVRRHTE